MKIFVTNKIWFGIILSCSCLFTPVYAENPIQYPILIQVSEDSVDRLNQALNNANHLIADFGYNNVEIEIVVLGAGVNTLRSITPFPIPDKIRDLQRLGVKILADEMAMKKANLTAKDMLTEVRYVASGLVELIEKQTQGWLYIRP